MFIVANIFLFIDPLLILTNQNVAGQRPYCKQEEITNLFVSARSFIKQVNNNMLTSSERNVL